jgi:hypothetical protein
MLQELSVKFSLMTLFVYLGLQNASIGMASTSTGQFMRKSHLVIDQENKDKFSFQHSDNSFRFNFDSGQKE